MVTQQRPFMRPPGFALFLLLICGSISKTTSQSNSKRIEDAIKKDYNKNVLPVRNIFDPVNVRVNVTIQHLDIVNETQQTMTLHGYIKLAWHDDFATWTPADFGNLNRVNIDQSTLWQPSLQVWNQAMGAEESSAFGWWGNQLIVDNTGNVSVVKGFTLTVTCAFDYTDYPYDEQQCPIAMGTWRYNHSRMTIEFVNDIADLQLTYAAQNRDHASGWRFLNVSHTIVYWTPFQVYQNYNQISTISKHQTYDVAQITLRVKRVAPYTGMLFFLPSIIATAITLLSFWIAEEQSTVLLLIANLIFQGIFMHDVIVKTPPTSGSLPRVVKHHGLNLGLTGVALLVQLLCYRLQQITSKVHMSLSARRLLRTRFVNALPNQSLSFDNRLYETGDKQLIKVIEMSDMEANVEVPGPSDRSDDVGQEWTWKELSSLFRKLSCLLLFVIYLLSTVVIFGT